MKKIKLCTEDQVIHMRDVNGILFNITNEEDAKHFLNSNNYYFKMKSYAKNYDTYIRGDKIRKYVNLEFAYLQELSRIDMYIRKFIIKITLDIEHFAKTKLMRDFSQNEKEDGYSLVKELFEKHPYIEKNIKMKARSNNSVCRDLINKYDDNFAVWNIIEVMTFGDFTNLYSLYYEKYSEKDSMVEFLWSVKFLRNAAAHNSCLLNSLKNPYTGIRQNKKINTYISKIEVIKPEERRKKMSNPVIHDFVVTLFVLNNIVSSKSLKKITLKELKDLIDNRFTKNKHYFEKNQIVITNYNFIKKIVDHFNEICI
ncbi:MAG: Abi family protein [Clostridium sp.]|uniref:Abi family protein n=1 Tax=Anaerorhabdus sp. TaxID=1872524 RepID=UPI002FCCA302